MNVSTFTDVRYRQINAQALREATQAMIVMPLIAACVLGW